MHQALSQGEMKLVMTIDKFATGRPAQFDAEGRLIQDPIMPDWKAALAMLERKFPERWAKRDHLKLYGATEGEDFRPDGSYEKMLETIERVKKRAEEDLEINQD
jgi:hypothetical protein